jgi:hypothetical protein
MLHRPDSQTRKEQRRAKRDAQQHREQQQRYAARARAGLSCVNVVIDAVVLDWLVRLHWLADGDANDRAAIGAAISKMLHESATRDLL